MFEKLISSVDTVFFVSSYLFDIADTGEEPTFFVMLIFLCCHCSSGSFLLWGLWMFCRSCFLCFLSRSFLILHVRCE